jgi:hypothetical protein
MSNQVKRISLDLNLDSPNNPFLEYNNFLSHRYLSGIPLSPMKEPTEYKNKIEYLLLKKELIKHIKTQKLIRIPESYEVTLELKSLLPNNLNNQLLQYAVNNIMLIENTEGTYQMNNVVKNISEQVNEAYEEAKNWSQFEDMSKVDQINRDLIREHNQKRATKVG